jgi:REP element-mobilizing transposase RayT
LPAAAPAYVDTVNKNFTLPGSMNDKTPKGRHSRGYLPHYDGGRIVQFVTCRLFDSLPQKVPAGFRAELERKNADDIEREVMLLIEKFLDSGYGECFLKRRAVAKIVRDSLKAFDGERYKLFAWVIMPNHIHFLLKPLNGRALEDIMHSLKSFTALEANKVLKRSGKFWMRGYFDRYIRDREHFEKAFRYIENNPVKAGLCKRPEDWQFNSAYLRKKIN